MNVDIAVMQVFSGISLFTILVLMALGLAIIFGLMGVINMAHGELMALGAYVTYMTAHVFEKFMPSLMGVYLFFAIAFSFIVTFVFGWILERGFIRFLYNRPLDTMLATWGLSLVLQQTYRSVFGAQEVSVPMTSWLEGAWEPVVGIQLPLNRLFIVGLTIIVAYLRYLALFKNRLSMKTRGVCQNRLISAARCTKTNKVVPVTFLYGWGFLGTAGGVFC